MTRTDTPSATFCTFLRRVDSTLHNRHNRVADAADLTLRYLDLVVSSYAEDKTAKETADLIIATVQ